MKRHTRLLSLLTVLLVFLLALSACTPADTTTTTESTTEATTTGTTAPTEPTIVDGIYETRFTPEGYSEFVNYFNFYPSGIFYLSLYNEGQYLAGYYEVVDMSVEYMPNPEDETEKAMSEQAIVLTNLDGSEYATLAYVDDVIYDLPTLYNRDFAHVLDTEHTSADENGIAIVEFMLGEDDYSLVRLMHNGTFQDTIGAMVEGTWAVDGDVYTLTDADTGEDYTVTLNADGLTAEYVALDGSTETLNLVVESPTLITFTGSNAEAAYGEMVVTIACKEDGTAEMTTEYAGNTISSEGAWVLADDNMSITLTFEESEYVAPINLEDNSFSFELATSDGVNDITVDMTTAEAVETVYTWTGESDANVILEMYSDGTCALIYSGMGTVTTGTWTIDTTNQLPAWTLTLAETIDGTDVEVPVESDYATKFYFAFTNSSGQLEATLALSFADYQAAAE